MCLQCPEELLTSKATIPRFALAAWTSVAQENSQPRLHP